MTRKKQKPSTPPFTTVHALPFESAPWHHSTDWLRFRVGTCEGLWRSTPVSFDILAITNSAPGNGHFEDVLQWFEFSCQRNGRYLRIMEIWNKNFQRHLILKRGFVVSGEDCIKKFV